jgi:hypothetical protein
MYRTVLFSVAIAGSIATAAPAEPVRGYYLEVRSTPGADIEYAHSGAPGHYAVMGWEVNHGEYRGVRLDGLTIVALIAADRDLADRHAERRVSLVVSNKATTPQHDALVGMVRHLAPEVMARPALVSSADIDLAVYQGCSRGYAKLQTGPIAIKTRRVLENDPAQLGSQRYSPLGKLFYKYPAWTTEFTSSGDEQAALKMPAFERSNQSTAVVGGFWVEPAAAQKLVTGTVAAAVPNQATISPD